MGNDQTSTNKCDNCGNVCSGLDSCWNKCGQKIATTFGTGGCTAESRAVSWNDVINLCKLGTGWEYGSKYRAVAYGKYGSYRFRCCKIGNNNNGQCDGSAAPMAMLPDGSENPDYDPNFDYHDIPHYNNPGDTYMMMNIGYVTNEISTMNYTIHGVMILTLMAILLFVINCIGGVYKYCTKKLSKSKSIGNVKYDKVAIVSE